MASFTPRLAIRLLGGGSSGTIPDEVVDVDDVNSSWEKIDNAVGAPTSSSTNRPLTPYDGQLIYESDTGKLKRFSTGDSQWHDAVALPVETPIYVQATEPNAPETDALWFW